LYDKKKYQSQNLITMDYKFGEIDKRLFVFTNDACKRVAILKKVVEKSSYSFFFGLIWHKVKTNMS